MLYLKSVQIVVPDSEKQVQFPFNLAVVQTFPKLELTSAVTLIVGDNGSGKSTFLEALACAIGSITVGSESVKTDPTLADARALARQMRIAWSKRTHKGFFLRAEDFFGYAKHIHQMRADLRKDLEAVDREYQGRSEMAKGLAKMPLGRELSELERRYGDGLDSQSHGESFLALFQTRFVPGGLYILDEPEAPLSPVRQLALISLIKQMVGEGQAQFIIATHSPILMAYPDAVIWSFDQSPIAEKTYDELENIQLMKAFLNNPHSYLRHL